MRACCGLDWVCLANAGHARIRDRITAKDFRREAHVLIRSDTGHQLLADALKEQQIVLDVALELPGFLGLPAIVGTTDLIATRPRHIGETLAHYSLLRPARARLPAGDRRLHGEAILARPIPSRPGKPMVARFMRVAFPTAGRAGSASFRSAKETKATRFAIVVVPESGQRPAATASRPNCLTNEPNSLNTGWGGRDRTSEWRNQNQLDYSTISRRVWKKS